MTECIVCQQTTNKYKCPKCFEPYCSLDCYKQHKESPQCVDKLNGKTKVAEVKECSNDINEPTVYEPFKTEDTVPQEKLKELERIISANGAQQALIFSIANTLSSLRSDLLYGQRKLHTYIVDQTLEKAFETPRTSDELKNLLYNPHLRNLLKEIDTAPNAWKAIRAAMHEPLFLEFADECLKIIEPATAEDEV